MHIRLIAVGERQPAWIEQAYANYAKRLPRQWRFTLDVISKSRRGNANSPAAAKQAEGEQILQKVSTAEVMVVLDERGTQLTSAELAGRLGTWMTDGRDLALVIGGADGLASECLQRADFSWSLSKLTLPHGLVRVLVAEQLYRAWAMSEGHPYHRA